MRPASSAIALLVALLMSKSALGDPRAAPPQTYCNPLNVDYAYCPIPDFVAQGKHRTSADPAIVVFRGDYYLFSTNQSGYWWSSDLARWNFVPRTFLKPEHRTLADGQKVYDDLCAPAVLALDDALLLLGSTYSKDFPIWKSADPRRNDWREAVPRFQAGAWDPALFLDDDGRLYLYHGSSNVYPIYGQAVDPRSLQPVGERRELIRLDDAEHGWERFGEANDNVFLRPFIEGAWMTKHAGKYYLQYAAPGTEFSGYADGVYVGEHPLGPFAYQAHNPFSYKPGGFARGAGHGGTFQDPAGGWWHTATIAIGVKNNFERRIGIWPAGFDEDGLLYCDTAYGDYPHYLPHVTLQEMGRADSASSSRPGEPLSGRFTGWMLLNYAKPVTASSTLGGFAPNFAVDEDIRTYWSAATGDAGEHFTTDLGTVSTVRAIQINYADQDATLMGRVAGLYHQYVLLASRDGQSWTTLVDKSENRSDVPHDYIELRAPVEARYVRIENRHVPTGKFALSGLRVFGQAHGDKPQPVPRLDALRGESERRNAWIKWPGSPDATGYVLRCGISPQKLYTSVMVYGGTEYYFRAMERDRPYFFAIEAFNENGVAAPSPVVKAD
jgi:hypothetical protein